MIRSFSIVVFVCCGLAVLGQENRTLNGSGNNINNPSFGSAQDFIERKATVNYTDGIGAVNDAHLPIPRKISNDLFSQSEAVYEAKNLSDYVWVFGQFLDHDISLVKNSNEHVGLGMPEDETFFVEPEAMILTSRSLADSNNGSGTTTARQYRNEVSAFIDASMIYGNDLERADWLRTFELGKLRTSQDVSNTGQLLPWNTITGNHNNTVIDFNAPDMESGESKYFVTGDVRANENPLLLSLHTLFVREHNRLCDQLAERYPNWKDEQLYQRARKMVGAYIQSITYYEWLPDIGVHLPEYQGYRENVVPRVFNSFSAAAFRMGHTLVNSKVVIMDDEGLEIPGEELTLKDVFFKPNALFKSDGIEAFFKGMGTQVMQEMDCKMVDDLRNFLIDPNGSTGLDLAAINIYRGRDRGLPDYNTLRQDFQLAPITDFSQITDSQVDVQILKDLYGDVNNIDAWVGMLSEKHVGEDAVFGELVMKIVKDQFKILRDGDRFYFENDNAFTTEDIETIKNTTLHDIIMRNTDISLMQPRVFVAMEHTDIPNGPQVAKVSLDAIVYPNPVLDNATIKIYSTEVQEISYKIFNSNGQVLSTGVVDLDIGDNFMELDIDAAWPRGLYSCLIESADDYSLVKLIKE